MIKFETSHGAFTVELFTKEAPISSENFQTYVDDKYFDGTIFHRIIPNFMIQGGGMTTDFAHRGVGEALLVVAEERGRVLDVEEARRRCRSLQPNFL